MRKETNSGGMKRTVRLLKPHVSPGLKEESSAREFVVKNRAENMIIYIKVR